MSVAYVVVLPTMPVVKAGDDAQVAMWLPALGDLGLAFDAHGEMVDEALAIAHLV